MKELSPEHRTLALAVLIGAVILSAFYFIFPGPRISRLRRLNPQIMTLTANIRSTTGDAANIDSFKRRREDLKDKVSFYEQKLPPGKEISSLLETLSGMAKDSQVEIIEIRPRDQKPRNAGEMYREVPIEIRAVAGYHQLGRFINQLESGTQFIRINDIEIKGTPRDDQRHNIRLLLGRFVLAE